MKECCSTGSYESCAPRSFLTNEEKIEMLNEYKDSLDKESQGVAEKIEGLEREE